MDLEKTKVYLDFAKFFLASVVVALITFWVNSGFKDREIAIKEQEYLAKFKDDALNEDIETRRRLAEYFSEVTLSVDARERWSAHLKLLTKKQEAQDANEEKIGELEKLLAAAKTDSSESSHLKQQLAEAIRKSERLERELSEAASKMIVQPKARGWVVTRYLVCPEWPLEIGMVCSNGPRTLNLRAIPSIRADTKLGVIPAGRNVQILGQPQDNWVEVEVTN